MSDVGYFVCGGVVLLSAIVAPFAARGVLRSQIRFWSSVALALAVVLGFVCSLPSGGTLEMPWLPLIAGTYFAAVVLTTVLYGMSIIIEKVGDNRENGKPKR